MKFWNWLKEKSMSSSWELERISRLNGKLRFELALMEYCGDKGIKIDMDEINRLYTERLAKDGKE